MNTRWLYTADKHQPLYYVTDGTIFAHPGGEAVFFISKGWAYTSKGKPAYRIDGEWLFAHPSGEPAFYFGEASAR